MSKPSIRRAAAFAAALCLPLLAIAQEPTPPAPPADVAVASPPVAAAPSAPATDAAAVPATPAEPAANGAGTATDTGTVVFFRDKKFTGGMINFKVREGGTELGKLSSGTYFTVQVPAGRHEYVVHSEAKDVLPLEVEPGETYYVLGSISMGVFAGRPNLAPSDQATFDGMKAGLKDVTAQP